MPSDREISYVKITDPFMQEAAKMAARSGCLKQSTGAVLVKNGKIIGTGNNHISAQINACPRDEQGYQTGEGYQLCRDVCKQIGGHSEINAVTSAQKAGFDTSDSDLYLFGHWWCCENCWNTMIAGNVNNVYLLEGATKNTDWNKILSDLGAESGV